MASTNTLGDRIKYLRKCNQLSQEEFGKLLGITHAHISYIENGKAKTSNTLLKLMTYEFHIDYDWLTSGKGSMKSKIHNNQSDIINYLDRIKVLGDELQKIHSEYFNLRDKCLDFETHRDYIIQDNIGTLKTIENLQDENESLKRKIQELEANT